MKVMLPFGRDQLEVVVPDGTVVVQPTDPPAIDDKATAVRGAVAKALADQGGRRPRRAVIVFPDLTRPMPNRTVLPPVLAELEALGVGADELTLLCATGTHRTATSDELRDLVGPDVMARYRIEQHVATDEDDHVDVGAVDGVPVLLARSWVEADLRITTGFVEPHFFAGFSGGPKGVCPGVASLSTILQAHSPTRIADRRATWLVLDGNPVHDFVSAATALCPPHVSVDVAIDRHRHLTGVWAGPLPASHRDACRFVEGTAIQRVPGRFDVVVSTNAGYPLDQNLYQAVKGMAAAERVVRPGGEIIMAAACEDGVPNGSAFDHILQSTADPATLLATETPPTLDYWEAQVLARVLGTARVSLYSTGLTDEQVRMAHLHPVNELDGTISAALRSAGSQATMCVLPQGPLTVATAS